MSLDHPVEITDRCGEWVSLIAAACFVEELELSSLPLSDALKAEVWRALEDLRQLSPMEALLRCLANPGTFSSQAI